MIIPNCTDAIINDNSHPRLATVIKENRQQWTTRTIRRPPGGKLGSQIWPIFCCCHFLTLFLHSPRTRKLKIWVLYLGQVCCLLISGDCLCECLWMIGFGGDGWKLTPLRWNLHLTSQCHCPATFHLYKETERFPSRYFDFPIPHLQYVVFLLMWRHCNPNWGLFLQKFLQTPRFTKFLQAEPKRTSIHCCPAPGKASLLFSSIICKPPL